MSRGRLTENWTLTGGQELEADRLLTKLCEACGCAPRVPGKACCKACAAKAEAPPTKEDQLLTTFLTLSGMQPAPTRKTAKTLAESYPLGIVPLRALGATEDAQDSQGDAPSSPGRVTYKYLSPEPTKQSEKDDEDEDEGEDEEGGADEQEQVAAPQFHREPAPYDPNDVNPNVAGPWLEQSEDEPDEPEEDDIQTEDHSKFYQSGKLVLTVDPDASEKEMWTAIYRYMHKTNFYPNVWFISDHGNAHLMRPPKGFRQPKHESRVMESQKPFCSNIGGKPYQTATGSWKAGCDGCRASQMAGDESCTCNCHAAKSSKGVRDPTKYQCPNCGYQTATSHNRTCAECGYAGDWIQPGHKMTYAQRKAGGRGPKGYPDHGDDEYRASRGK